MRVLSKIVLNLRIQIWGIHTWFNVVKGIKTQTYFSALFHKNISNWLYPTFNFNCFFVYNTWWSNSLNNVLNSAREEEGVWLDLYTHQPLPGLLELHLGELKAEWRVETSHSRRPRLEATCPYAIKTQRKTRNASGRGLWVSWAVSLWYKRGGVVP